MAFKVGNKINVGKKNALGVKRSIETKEKIRNARLGKKLSIETRRKMSLSKIGNTNNKGRKGELNHQWKGGKDKFYQQQALLKENYTCQICLFRDVEIMEVDHILPKSTYPELRHDINNLQVLCPNCHRRKSNKEKKYKLYVRQ